MTLRSPSGVPKREAGPVEAVERDAGRRHVERRPRIPAGGARPGAEVPEIHRVVAQPLAADPAPLRVGGVGEARESDARVVDPVRERSVVPGQPRHERVVGVSDEPPRAGGRDPPPAGRDGLELAVAVELIAEQVPEAEHPRCQRRRHRLERGLVDLEDAQIGAAAREQCRRDAGGEVRAGGVPAQPPLGLEHRRQHLRGRGLAVRRRDHNGSAGDPARQASGWRRAPSAEAACPAGSCRRRPPHAVTALQPPVLRRPWRGRRSSARILSAALPPSEFDGAAGHGF